MFYDVYIKNRLLGIKIFIFKLRFPPGISIAIIYQNMFANRCLVFTC